MLECGQWLEVGETEKVDASGVGPALEDSTLNFHVCLLTHKCSVYGKVLYFSLK